MKTPGDLNRSSEMFYRTFIIILLLSALASCVRDKPAAETSKPGTRDLEDINRYLVMKDRERIINFAERKQLELTETPTGLWYQLYKHGEGDFLIEGMKITMEYECSLLDGTRCYSSEESGPKVITLGRTGIEPGLYQGLKVLKPGGEAIFIIPPFLAHGLPGDGNKIPPRSVIVYKVKILAVE